MIKKFAPKVSKMKRLSTLLLFLSLLTPYAAAQDTPGTVKYPAASDSLASLIQTANDVGSALNGAINSSVTTLTLTSATAFPASGSVSIDNEIIFYTGKSGNQLTGLVRGADGTTAASHADGATVEIRIISRLHGVLADAIIAMQTKWPGSLTGIIASNGTSPAVGRTLQGTANKISITNPTGASGDPTFTLPDSLMLVDPTVTGLLSVRTGNKSIASLENALESFILLSGEDDYGSVGFQRGTSGIPAATGKPLFNFQLHQRPNAASGVTVANFFFAASRHGSTSTNDGNAEAVGNVFSLIESDSTNANLAGQNDTVAFWGYNKVKSGSTTRGYGGYLHVFLDSTAGNGVGLEANVENESGVDSPLTAIANRTVLLALTASGSNANGIGILFNATLAAAGLRTGIRYNANSVVSGAPFLDVSALSSALISGATIQTLDDSATNAVSNIFTLGHNTSGTPAAGYGTGFRFRGESSTTADRDMAQLSSVWTTATDASRAADFVMSFVSNGGSLTEAFRFNANDLIQVNANSSGFGPSFLRKSSRGTVGSPTTSLTTDRLSSEQTYGYITGTGYVEAVEINVFQEGTATGGLVPSIYSIRTTKTGGALTEAFNLMNTGSVLLGPRTGGTAASASATDSFVYFPTIAGRPTGTPTAFTNLSPVVIDSTNHKLQFYTGSAWKSPDPMRFASVTNSSAISNTTSQTAFSVTYSIPANLLTAGAVIRVTAHGSYSTTGTPSVSMAVRIGGQTVGSGFVGAAAGASGNGWNITQNATVRTVGASGTIQRGQGIYAMAGGSLADNNSNGTITVDTTGALTLDIAWTWTAASPSNTTTLEALTVEILYPGQTT